MKPVKRVVDPVGPDLTGNLVVDPVVDLRRRYELDIGTSEGRVTTILRDWDTVKPIDAATFLNTLAAEAEHLRVDVGNDMSLLEAKQLCLMGAWKGQVINNHSVLDFLREAGTFYPPGTFPWA